MNPQCTCRIKGECRANLNGFPQLLRILRRRVTFFCFLVPEIVPIEESEGTVTTIHHQASSFNNIRKGFSRTIRTARETIGSKTIGFVSRYSLLDLR